MATVHVGVLLLLACGWSAAADTKPVAPKNIDVALKARWPQTPIAVEAAEFLAEEGNGVFWDFVKTYKPPAADGTDREHLEAVEAVVASLLSPLGLKLLRAFLAAHVYSPRVEMWRQLASTGEEAHGLQAAAGWVAACGRVQELGTGANTHSYKEEPGYVARTFAEAVVAEGCQMPASLEEREASSDVAPLAVDHVHPGFGAAVAAPFVVLYAPLGSRTFEEAHVELAQRAKKGLITYAYRPLVRAAVDPHSGRVRSQTLQGYGVQLAIKNMEYKVLDDKAVNDLGGIGEEGEASADAAGQDDTTEVGGFYFGTLARRRPELASALKEMREQVAAAEGDASSLKVWAVQDLGVQASSRVLSAAEPLSTLATLCQNFPFTARTLSKLPVNRALASEVQHLQQTMYGQGFSGLFLNGLPLPITDNDFFGLLQTIQREMHTIDKLATLQLPSRTISRLVSLPPPTASLRITTAHSAVMWLNDVEKDQQYAQFKPQLREMLRMSMWGQMSFCRRNVLNMIFVLDPAEELSLQLLSYMAGVHANGAPVRFGIVLAPGATSTTIASSKASQYLTESGMAPIRLRALADIYDWDEWGADDLVKEMEGIAQQNSGASGSGVKSRASSSGGVAAASEEVRIGRLLTKCFYFIKKKGGSGASMRFLSSVNEARQSAASSFFFGGSMDALSETHVQTAFSRSFSSSMRKAGYDPNAVFDALNGGVNKLAKLNVQDYNDLVDGGVRFLEEKGIGQVPAMLMNGVLTAPITPNYEQEIMEALQKEHRAVSGLVHKGQLTDEMTDLPAAIARAHVAFPRYSAELLLPIESITVSNLPENDTLKAHVMWISAPGGHVEATASSGDAGGQAAAPAAGSGNQGAYEDAYGYAYDAMEEMMGGGEMGDEGEMGEAADADADESSDAPSALEIHSVSHLLVVDLCNATHLAVVAGALTALQDSPKGRARLGLLHNPHDGDMNLNHCAPKAAAAWHAIAHFADMKGNLTELRQLVAFLHAAALTKSVSAWGHTLAHHLLPDYCRAAVGAQAAGSGAVDMERHIKYASSIGFSAGEGALLTNGRVVKIGGGDTPPLDAVDISLLEEFEYRMRAEGAAKLVAPMETPVEEEAGAGGTIGGVEYYGRVPGSGVGGDVAAWRSSVLMHTVAELSHVAQRATQQSERGDGRKVQLQTDDLPCGAACIRIPGTGAGEAMELVAVLDPLSKQAQRLAPILMELHQALGLTIMLHLNPDTSISEFPLENFYRYVVSLTPSFDEYGTSLAPSADTATFAALRTPQVLTLHVDAPEAWLIELTEAAYDMDNLRLTELGERRTVYARYELVSLLITGSCEDILNPQQPPNGLQLLLGSRVAPHATDTLVMSNLGYFQLKAMPGAWHLSLAPGPSSEVYQISGERSLLAAGHSSRVGRRLGHLDPGSLTPLPSAQLLVSDFGGMNALLLVQKKAGMQAVSILDDDKQSAAAGATAGTDGAGAGDGSMLGSFAKWFGGSAASVADDDTVHVFSLASGHLYERFLKIMMQSVVQRTSRKVKFWLLKNFLSPAFMGFLPQMAEAVGFEYALVQYQWPSWLHKQTNKQRIIWGYKILFLDVMFPLQLKKIIYIDADQVVNADVGELWDMSLGRAAVGMTPFCQRDANKDTTGFRFFAEGYWKDHLRGRPYHISALFVVDLHKFRRRAYGDQYRIFYDSLSKDPNSLSNLDQDLPNYAQHVVPIFSLPEEWLWCETWCGNSSKPSAKTIDLCNNPLTKEPKLNQATRLIGARWSELDQRATDIAEAEPTAPQKLRDEL